MPGILTDVMELCKDMNEMYLWVDRLCVIQDDPASKMSQIQAMDDIYRSATFTIAAALNSNEGKGLPGYGGLPRYPSPSTPRSVHSEDSVHKGVRPNTAGRNLSSSRWNERGWTFQERLLSRRTIYITEDEVRFECAEERASEPETWSYDYMELLPHEYSQRLLGCKPDELDDLLQQRKQEEETAWLHGLIPTQSRGSVDWMGRSPPTLVQYCRWVEEYTGRRLSFPSDILNAFAGAGKVVSDALDSRMLFGLPEKCLPQALMWERTENSSEGPDRGRRPPAIQVDGVEIPSWSWAHTAGRAQYWWMDSQGKRIAWTTIDKQRAW
ncbi:hypothetical protein PG985_008304 [Apiospora marii]|uniref:uncharacterized protein n=1 Tax=Apiospora marii TaxID=335849 RepID=UPI00312D1086